MQCAYCKSEVDEHGVCAMYQSFADEHIKFWLNQVLRPGTTLTRVVAIPPPPPVTIARIPVESVRGIIPRVLNGIRARALSLSATRRPILVDRIGLTCSVCGSQFPDGDDACGRGHRIGEVVAFVCSACNTTFSPISRRCGCGLDMYEVPIIDERA